MGSIPTRRKLHNNLRQVVHTYVPLSPSSITWYWSKDGGILRLERWPHARWKVMAAYRWDDLKSHLSNDPVYWDQLRAQRSVTSMGELYKLLKANCYKSWEQKWRKCNLLITYWTVSGMQWTTADFRDQNVFIGQEQCSRLEMTAWNLLFDQLLGTYARQLSLNITLQFAIY